jgi:hypothetical protein
MNTELFEKIKTLILLVDVPTLDILEKQLKSLLSGASFDDVERWLQKYLGGTSEDNNNSQRF